MADLLRSLILPQDGDGVPDMGEVEIVNADVGADKHAETQDAVGGDQFAPGGGPGGHNEMQTSEDSLSPSPFSLEGHNQARGPAQGQVQGITTGRETGDSTAAPLTPSFLSSLIVPTQSKAVPIGGELEIREQLEKIISSLPQTSTTPSFLSSLIVPGQSRGNQVGSMQVAESFAEMQFVDDIDSEDGEDGDPATPYQGRSSPPPADMDNQPEISSCSDSDKMSTTTTNGPSSSRSTGGITGTQYSVAEYLAQHAPHFSAVQQKQDAKKLAQQQTASQQQAKPLPNTASSSELPKPLLASKTHVSTNTVKLHDLCQARGFTPRYDYAGATDVGWGAELVLIEGERVSDSGPYASKREAKEAVSEKGVALFERLVAEGKIGPKEKKQKNKGAVGGGDAVAAEKEEPGENFVGKLLEYQNSLNAAKPIYTEYILGHTFCCELSLPTLSTHPPAPRLFGGQSAFFPSKKAARQNAARDAVDWLKSTGKWPEETGGAIRKKRKQNPAPTQQKKAKNTGTGTGASESSGSDAGNNASSGDSTSGQNSNSAAAKSENQTPNQSNNVTLLTQVLSLARELSLPAPEYRFSVPDANLEASGFYTVAAYFLNCGPEFEGPVGEVRHVFGKKRAKEECARLVLGFLGAVKERRLKEMESVLAEMDGAL